MKYYMLKKNNGKLIEVKEEDVGFDIRPARIYQSISAYFGVGETARKFLSIIEKVQKGRKMNKEMEEYWDNVANNWIEKLEKENVK